MKRLLFMIALGLAVTAYGAQAQSLNAGQVQFTLDGVQVGTLSLPVQQGGDPAGPYTWALPKASGTLALGGTNAWEVGGQALGLTGLLGSTDAQDVGLIAGGTTLLTLDESDDAVLIPPAAQLRLGALNGGNYFAIEAPDDITPDGTNAGNITYIFPDQAPGGDDVRMKVKSITVNGNDRVVEMDWTNPNTTGQIGFEALNVPTCDDGSAGPDAWYDVVGGDFVVQPDGIFSFELYLDITDDNVEITWGSPGGDVADAVEVSINYKSFELTGNGNNPGGTEANVMVLDGGSIHLVKGYIETGINTPANTTVQLLMQEGTGAGAHCISNKSSVQLVTE